MMTKDEEAMFCTGSVVLVVVPLALVTDILLIPTTLSGWPFVVSPGLTMYIQDT